MCTYSTEYQACVCVHAHCTYLLLLMLCVCQCVLCLHKQFAVLTGLDITAHVLQRVLDYTFYEHNTLHTEHTHVKKHANTIHLS